MVSNSFCRKSTLTTTGSKSIVVSIVFKDIGKKAAYNHPEPVVIQGPCSVFATRSATKVFSPNQNFTRICIGLLSTNSGFGWFERSYRQSRKRLSPNPFRSTAFRKRAGIIWSVSTFSMGSGTAGDINLLKIYRKPFCKY
jgi:hypothetical protein